MKVEPVMIEIWHQLQNFKSAKKLILSIRHVRSIVSERGTDSSKKILTSNPPPQKNQKPKNQKVNSLILKILIRGWGRGWGGVEWGVYL